MLFVMRPEHKINEMLMVVIALHSFSQQERMVPFVASVIKEENTSWSA